MKWPSCQVIFWLAMMLVGCNRKADGPAAATAPSDLPVSPRGAAMTSTQTTAVAIQDSGDINVTLQQLTAALRDYVVQSHSVPRNFDDFAAKSKLSFPPPPAGKKYVISGQAVVLAKH